MDAPDAQRLIREPRFAFLAHQSPPELLGQRPTVFPSHHGDFLGGEFGYAGQPEALARKLRDVLDHEN